jgi:DNA (cytosine-5)-methyltransferase 1
MFVDSEGKPRVPTSLERERIMGFPDNYTKYGLFDGNITEISDAQRIKTTGNAVAPYVIRYVVQHYFES